jgi:hypothetical protein
MRAVLDEMARDFDRITRILELVKSRDAAEARSSTHTDRDRA